jgi:hypothetical protein
MYSIFLWMNYNGKIKSLFILNFGDKIPSAIWHPSTSSGQGAMSPYTASFAPLGRSLAVFGDRRYFIKSWGGHREETFLRKTFNPSIYNPLCNKEMPTFL